MQNWDGKSAHLHFRIHRFPPSRSNNGESVVSEIRFGSILYSVIQKPDSFLEMVGFDFDHNAAYSDPD